LYQFIELERAKIVCGRTSTCSASGRFPDRCVQVAQGYSCLKSGSFGELQGFKVGHRMSDTRGDEPADMDVRFGGVSPEKHTQVLKACQAESTDAQRRMFTWTRVLRPTLEIRLLRDMWAVAAQRY
jgi:hypothetical protein